jgi:hypothetical protein
MDADDHVVGPALDRLVDQAAVQARQLVGVVAARAGRGANLVVA